jgi:hypothetical protein
MLAIDRFTYAPVTGDTARVRLRGRWRAPAGARMPAPRLVIAPGPGEHSVAPLDRGFAFPDGGREAPAPWRTTYLVPLDAFTQQGGFALRLPGIAVWPLPLPTPEPRADGAAVDAGDVELDALNGSLAALAERADAPADRHAPVDVARGAAHVLGYRLAAQHEAIAQLDAELARAREAAGARAEELSSELAAADQRATTAESRAAIATGEALALRDRVTRLERREAHLALRLSATHTRAQEADEARAALESQAAELAAEIEELERQVADHVRGALASADVAANGDGLRDALEARALQLEEHVAELTRQSAELAGAA